jgi:hypothetical protein
MGFTPRFTDRGGHNIYEMEKDGLTYYVGARVRVNSVEMVRKDMNERYTSLFLVRGYSEYQVYQLIRKHVKTIR